MGQTDNARRLRKLRRQISVQHQHRQTARSAAASLPGGEDSHISAARLAFLIRIIVLILPCTIATSEVLAASCGCHTWLPPAVGARATAVVADVRHGEPAQAEGTAAVRPTGAGDYLRPGSAKGRGGTAVECFHLSSHRWLNKKESFFTLELAVHPMLSRYRLIKQVHDCHPHTQYYYIVITSYRYGPASTRCAPPRPLRCAAHSWRG